MHKMTAEMEKGLPPDPSEMAAIGQLMEDAAKQKIMPSGERMNTEFSYITDEMRWPRVSRVRARVSSQRRLG
jgi:hypothetical protein